MENPTEELEYFNPSYYALSLTVCKWIKVVTMQNERVTSQDFRTLGIESSASRQAVKSAYRELVKRWHPDHFQGKPFVEQQRAEEILKEITAAYRRISGSWKGVTEEGKSRREKSSRPAPDSSPPKPGAAEAQPPPNQETPRFDGAGTEFTNHIGGRLKKIFSRESRWYSRPSTLIILLILFFSTIAYNYVQEFLHQPPSPTPWQDYSVPSTGIPPPLVTSPHGTQEPREGKKPSNLSTGGMLYNHGGQTNSPYPAYFSLGSTQAEVRRIQGPPAQIRGQVWVYGMSSVSFRDGRVAHYDNFGGFLKVRLFPSASPQEEPHDFFTLGSTADEVALVQGTPTRVEEHRWYYASSEVRFKEERVVSYDNFFGNLKIRITPSPSFDRTNIGDYYTIGSTKDEVLALEGTPSSIQGNVWFYQFSNIVFREGKVQSVSDAGGSLHFAPPEEGSAK